MRAVQIVVICVMIVLVGCVDEQDTLEQDYEEIDEFESFEDNLIEIQEEENISEIIEEEIEEKILQKTNDPIIEELTSKQSRINSYRYDYYERDSRLVYQENFIDVVYVLEDKIMVDYGRLFYDDEGFAYNRLYLDDEMQSAYYVCYGDRFYACNSSQESDGVYKETEYDYDMVRNRPFDLFDELSDAQFHMNQNIRNTQSIVVVEEDDDVTLTMWISEYYGMPLKVEYDYDEYTIELYYNDIAYNRVNEKDVTLPSRIREK